MSAQKLTFVDDTVKETYTWLHEICQEMHEEDPQKAYHALRGVLFALRDRIPLEESVDLAAQLPMLIRGIFFEGYTTSHKPEKYRNPEDFYAKITRELQPIGESNPTLAAKAVFNVLDRHISPGEMAQVRKSLPQGFLAGVAR